jgi:hypothetical protein
LMTSTAICACAFSVAHIAEALTAIALGGIVYSLTHKRVLRLPETPFHLEESPLYILVGFFVVFALLAWGA